MMIDMNMPFQSFVKLWLDMKLSHFQPMVDNLYHPTIEDVARALPRDLILKYASTHGQNPSVKGRIPGVEKKLTSNTIPLL